MEKIKILKEILGGHYTSNEEHLFSCPYCKHHKKKLSINIEKNFFKCWVCDMHGRSIRRVVRRFGSFQQLKAWDSLNQKEDISRFDDIFEESQPEQNQRASLPQEFATLTGKNLPPSAKHATSYLSNRGITTKDIISWKIGFCARGEYQGRIVIPSFDEEGYVNYFVARSYDKNWKRYLNPPLSRDIVFNHLSVDWDADIVIVEGVFDAIKAGLNSVPLLGSTLREESRLFQEIIKNDASVFIALDEDAKLKSEKVISRLLTYGMEVYKIDVSGYNDVGEMTKEEFKKRKASASFINEDTYFMEQALSNI